jgi:hypothetical protein
MSARQCYHCKEWIEPGAAHDCWTTTEAALTRDLADDLREAWERIRETAAEFGEQRIYASGKAIMFARERCYFFVRPRVQSLEVCVFLGRTVKSPLVRRADARSRTKVAHTILITHRDQVEPPMTDWLHEAYETTNDLSAAARPRPAAPRRRAAARPRPAAPRKRAAARTATTSSAAGRRATKPATSRKVRGTRGK